MYDCVVVILGGKTMVNRYLNNILIQMEKILACPIGIIDGNSNVIPAGKIPSIDENCNEIIDICSKNPAKATQMSGYTFYPTVLRGRIDNIAFVLGDDAEAEKNVRMLSAYINSIKQMNNDKFDKTNFIKNILADSILPGDIFLKSKELHLSYDVDRVVFALQYDEVRGIDIYDIIKELFPDNGKDFVIDLDNNMIVIVKEISIGTKRSEFEKMARQITDTVTSEAMINLRLGIGSVATNIRDIAKSYKEARIALEVGKVFDGEKNIINYDNLGIARLIYQLPTTLCELFLSEIFKKESIDSLDSETLYTIQKFFENNLNVSETSRQLYVHRNTLVYRLDKVKKITGLDLRIFDHAIVFKVALMVKKYLVSKPVRI